MNSFTMAGSKRPTFFGYLVREKYCKLKKIIQNTVKAYILLAKSDDVSLTVISPM